MTQHRDPGTQCDGPSPSRNRLSSVIAAAKAVVVAVVAKVVVEWL